MRSSHRISRIGEAPACRHRRAGAPFAARTGLSILEMTVALAVASALLGSAAMMVSRMMNAQRNVEVSSRQTLVLSRLSRQFRSDVHAAASVTIADDGAAVELTPLREAGRTVRYTAGDGSLERASTGEGADRFEQYVLSTGTTFRFSTESLGDLTLLQLHISRPPSPLPGTMPLPRRTNEDGTESTHARAVPGLLRIESVAGRDLLTQEAAP